LFCHVLRGWFIYYYQVRLTPRQAENIAQQRAGQTACSTTYHNYENHFHKDLPSNQN
jgi:hypothetical protein